MNVRSYPSENCPEKIEKFVELLVAQYVVVDRYVTLGSDAETQT
jgi:hypothetical protein